MDLQWWEWSSRHSRLALLVFWTLWAIVLHVSLLFAEKALALRTKLLDIVVLQAGHQVTASIATAAITIATTLGHGRRVR